MSVIARQSPPAGHNSASFRDLLATAGHSGEPQKHEMTAVEPVVLVGTISADVPTVSELLKAHGELSRSTWDIIYSKENRNKDYTALKPGTNIYYNPKTAALSWPDPFPDSNTAGTNNGRVDQPQRHSTEAFSKTGAVGKEALHGISVKQPSSTVGGELIKLGTLDDSNPTVSHLLKNHSQLREHTWELLAYDANKDKGFDRIAGGTEIYFNVRTMEIVWDGPDTAPVRTPAVPAAVAETFYPAMHPVNPAGHPAPNLSEAVQQYLGRSYDEMNCYELVVKGLRQMDIPYAGKDGLFSKLTRMAVERGLAPNAYLNGEGIIKAAGSLVMTRNYRDVSNWQHEAAALVKEIEPLLDSGQILSFSTEKRGHTGVISQKNSQWTFINSGRLDNPVSSSSLNHGVGEEVLEMEIGNWFKTAQAEKATLTVTLGRLEQAKIQTAYNVTGSVSTQI